MGKEAAKNEVVPEPPLSQKQKHPEEFYEGELQIKSSVRSY